jgi:type I restriction enzyme S subunit
MLRFKWETEFKEAENAKLRIQDGNAHFIVARGVCGNVPKVWKIKSIDEDYHVYTGKRVSPINEGLFPVYGANGFSGYSDFFTVNEEVIITGRVGTLGQAFYVCKKVNISDNALYITKKNKEASLKFLYYAMKLIFCNIEEVLNVGTTQPLIKQSEVKKFLIPFPDYEEQLCLASVLSFLDDLIANKNRQNEILEKGAIAIFKSWFVDFEPFKDGHFVDSKIGKVPSGWASGYTTNLIEFDPKVDLEIGQAYPFVEMKNVSTSSMVFDFDSKKYAGSGAKFRGEDTLLARITPCLENGKTAFIWFMDKERTGFGTTEFIVMRPKKECLEEFVYLLARTEEFREYAINSMTGSSGRQRVEKDALQSFEIVIPPEHVLKKFHSLLKPLFKRIILNQKQIMVVRKIRDSLLPLLVFGKLRVEEI